MGSTALPSAHPDIIIVSVLNPSSCFYFKNTTFWRLDSVSVLGSICTSPQNASVVTKYFAEATTQLQNAVRSLLSEMEPEESVAFASPVSFYNGRILCARVDAPLRWHLLSWAQSVELVPVSGHITK
jgi:hypothetical protein